jgi:hypothetical protein
MIPLADTAKQKRTPVVTMVLVAANLCAFGWELWLGRGGGRLGVSLGEAGQGQEQAGECKRASEESGPVFHGELGGVV